jgi:hypothetical protein
MMTMTPIQKMAINIAAEVLASNGPKLAQVEPVRRHVVSKIEKRIVANLEQARSDSKWLPGVVDDRMAMSLAIVGTLDTAKDLVSATW